MAIGIRTLALASAAAIAAYAAPAWAQAAPVNFDIPPQALSSALRQFAAQSGREVMFDPAVVAGKQAPGLKGQFEAPAALEKLLSGQGLRVQAAGQALVIATGPIRVSTAPAPAAAAVAAAPVQTAPASVDTAVEEVVVIGSKIAGANLTGSLPVSVVDATQIKAQGTVSTGDLVARLPQSGSQNFNSGVQGPNNARGDVASANLRNLGSGNTLVLLDGRRMVLHPTSQQEGGVIPVQVVNLNAIPSSALRQVEVLRDGASAIYGSDATAGVLNFVIDRNFEGAQVTARYGASEGTNLVEKNLSFKAGASFNGGRTHAVVFGELFHNTAMPGNDRDYAGSDDLSGRVAAAYSGFFNRNQTQSPWATARVSTAITGLGASFTTFLVQPCAFDASRPATRTPGACINGGASVLPASLRTDEGPVRTMIPRTTRGSVMGVIDHELTKDITLFGDLLYYQASAHAERGGSTLLTDAPLVVSRNNPHNPFGSGPGRLAGYTGAAQDVTLVGYNVLDVGNRNFDVDNRQFRGVIGVKGRAGDWRWETSGVWSRARTTDTEHNRVSNVALQAALSSSDPATAYNPFNGGDQANLTFGDATFNPTSVTDRLRIDLTRRSVTKLGMATFEVSNPAAIPLADRGVGFAAGLEWRYESYDDYRDPRVNGTINYVTPTGAATSDVVGTSPTLDTHGDRNVFSAYSELRSMLVRPEDGVPLMQSFEVQAAARFERYSDTKDKVLKPKIAASWGVNDMVKLRASYSEAFRAPNLEQINAAPAVRVQQNQTDLYRCALAQGARTFGAINRNACATFRNDVSEARSGSNTLKAEDAKTVSFGLVLTPIRRLVITIDWWRIKQTGLVGAQSTQDQINLDAIGRLGGGGPNPLVIRDANNLVTNVQAILQNLNSRTVEASDFGISYTIPTQGYGDFRLNADMSVFGKFYVSPSPEAAALVGAGLATAAGGSQVSKNGTPRTRASATAIWSAGPWQVTGSGVYISRTFDGSALSFPVSSWTTFNASVRYAPEEGAFQGTSFRLGVNNIQDKDPPLANALFGHLTGLYNPRGRFWYLEVSKSF